METSLADADYSDECCRFGWTAGDNVMLSVMKAGTQICVSSSELIDQGLVQHWVMNGLLSVV